MDNVSKRKVSILLPYITNGSSLRVYLQKRSKDAERLPDYFGFFGGGIEEDESPEEALIREIREEMDFFPQGYVHFKTYEFGGSMKHIYLLRVDQDFESKIKILEGDYGKWFNEQEIINESKLIDTDKLVLREVYRFILYGNQSS